MKKLIIVIFFINFLSVLSQECEKLPKITFLKSQKEVKLTIFIHGTHFSKYLNTLLGQPNTLTKISNLSSISFYKCVMKSLIKSCPEEFPLDHFYLYGWPGELNQCAREQAAFKLYNLIKNKVKKNKHINFKITIIGHSHGGTIGLNLAKFFNEKTTNFKVDKLILLGTPILEENKPLVSSNLFNTVYNIYSSLDVIQLLDIQKFHSASKDKNFPVFSCRRFEPSPNLKQTKIKINDRAIFHLEFILDKFLTILPCLIKKMDSLDSKKSNYLIKVNTKNESFETLDSGKKINNEAHCTEDEDKNNITIFIHGSHNGSSRILIKYVDVINLLRPVSQLDPRKYHSYLIAKYFCKNLAEFNSFYTFGWSGRVSNIERFKAAQILYDEIKKLALACNSKPKITIITHSHGGNVVLNLAKVAEQNNDDSFKIDKIIMLACPVQENTKYCTKSPVFEKIYHIYSSLDAFQVLDPQGLHKINKCKKVPFFSQRRFDDLEKLKQGKIKINNRSLMHVEFILEDFISMLPQIVVELDKRKVRHKDLIKVDMKRIK